MKKKLTYLSLLLTLVIAGCKKDISEDITNYYWVLESQTVTPAITINGKTSTNYLSLQQPEGCTKNNTLTLTNEGIFYISSNGSLCDMAAASKSQKWIRSDNQLILTYDGGTETIYIINDDKIINTTTLTIDNSNYELVTIRKAKKK